MSDINWQANAPLEANLRTDSAQYNQGTREKQQIHEERNTAENWAPIMALLASGWGRDISDEPKQAGKPPAFVISSGPSLDDTIDALRDWKGGIFCSTSHATTLMYHGVEPTHLVVLDPFCSQEEITGVDWSKTRTKLIVNPSVWPGLIAQWPNEVLFFLQNVGKRDSYYATTQKHMFTRRDPDTPKNRTPTFHNLIRTEITLFACTPPCQMFCADILGYGRIFLAGCDYAFHSGKCRFTRWQPDASGTWQKDESLFEPNPGMIRTDNGLWSDMTTLYYKKNHISAWRLSLQDCWRIGQGALTEVPQAKLSRVIASQGTDYESLSKAKIIERTEGYLARVGAYIIKSGGDSSAGISFVECPAPLTDLPRYMTEVRHNWKCPRCNSGAKANDDKDYGTVECPVCHNIGLQRVADIDIEHNMERITRLVKQAERENARRTATAQGQVVAPPPGCAGTVIGIPEPVAGTVPSVV